MGSTSRAAPPATGYQCDQADRPAVRLHELLLRYFECFSLGCWPEKTFEISRSTWSLPRPSGFCDKYKVAQSDSARVTATETWREEYHASSPGIGIWNRYYSLKSINMINKGIFSRRFYNVYHIFNNCSQWKILFESFLNVTVLTFLPRFLLRNLWYNLSQLLLLVPCFV